jgi:hypothetical protein
VVTKRQRCLLIIIATLTRYSAPKPSPAAQFSESYHYNQCHRSMLLSQWRIGSCPLNTCRKFQVYNLLVYAIFYQQRVLNQALARPLFGWMEPILNPHIVATPYMSIEPPAKSSAVALTDRLNQAFQSPTVTLSLELQVCQVLRGNPILRLLSWPTKPVLPLELDHPLRAMTPRGVAIGVGVGVPLGVIALFTTAWAL